MPCSDHNTTQRKHIFCPAGKDIPPAPAKRRTTQLMRFVGATNQPQMSKTQLSKNVVPTILQLVQSMLQAMHYL